MVEDDGAVYVARVEASGATETTTRFRAMPVLAIAYNYYRTRLGCTPTVAGVLREQRPGEARQGDLSPLAAARWCAAGTFDLACR